MNLPNFRKGVLSVSDKNEIYWESYGNPDGIPVLLIHGGSGFTFDLEEISAFDPQRYLIVTWHQRGEGKSEPLPHTNDASIFNHVHDIESLRKHLGIEKWHIFSWSFGAIFMTAYACSYPQNCESLSAYAPFLGDKEDWDVLLTNAPDFAEGLKKLYNAKTISDAKRKAVDRANTWDRQSRLKDVFKRAVLEGYKGDETTFFKSKTDTEWDRELARLERADKLYNEAINELGRRWLYTLAHKNAAFMSLPVTLFFGTEDIYAAPNTNTRLIFPHASLVMIKDGAHDVHDSLVQKKIGESLHTASAINTRPSLRNP